MDSSRSRLRQLRGSKQQLNSSDDVPSPPPRDDSMTMRGALKAMLATNVEEETAPPPVPERDDTGTFRNSLKALRGEEKTPTKVSQETQPAAAVETPKTPSDQQQQQPRRLLAFFDFEPDDATASSPALARVSSSSSVPSASTTTTSSSSSSSSVAKKRDEAVRLLKQGFTAESIAAWSEVVALDPSADHLAGRAGAYLRLGQADKAEEDCTKAVAADAQNAKAWGRLGMALLLRSPQEEDVLRRAVDAFDRCQQIDSSRPELKWRKKADKQWIKMEKSLQKKTRRSTTANTPSSASSSPASSPASSRRAATLSSSKK